MSNSSETYGLYSLPSSSVHRVLQARILVWVAKLSSRKSSLSRDWTHASYVSGIAGGFFMAQLPAKPIHLMYGAKSHHLGPTLCNPMDCSLPGPSIHEILQARILEWIALPSSWIGCFPNPGIQPCLLYLLHWQAGSLPLALPGTHIALKKWY